MMPHPVRMIVRRYEDLKCWQLANRLKREVYAIIRRPHVAKDFKFCDQIRASARSAPSNIAEGFGRYRPKENARFCEIAKASLTETHNHILDAVDQEYITQEEWKALSELADHAIRRTTKYIVYLKGRGRSHGSG